jgi:hypothetical protein
MKSKIVFIVVLFVTFGGIFVADLLGYWQTTSTKQPSLIKEGALAGLSDPEDIRGSYSFGDIEDAFNIKAADLAKAFNIKTDQPELVKAKDIEAAYAYLGEDVEIGTGAVKMFVSIYNGIPLGEIESLPSTAVAVLKEHGKWTPELEAQLAEHIIDVANGAPSAEPIMPLPSESEHETTGVLTEVSGKTTASDVISAGLTLAEIEEIMGIKIPNPNLTIRDLCDKNDLSFSTVKADISAKLVK